MRYQQEQLNVPMSAMIDVVFLLLIFFISTYQDELFESRVSIQQPAYSQSRTASRQTAQAIEIHILPGEYRMMGTTPITLDIVAGTLQMLMRYDREQTVLVRVHDDARHQELISLLDQCKRAGVAHLNLAQLRK